MTVYLEDLQVGMSASLTHTVTEHDIELFGQATGDRNPVHFDEEFAKKTIFRGRVAHGALLVGYVSAVIGNQLPGPGTIFGGAAMEFKAPLRLGDTVTVTCTVRSIEGRKVTLDCISRVGETVVAQMEARAIAPKRPPAAPTEA
ncbi:MAG: MaoC family dehydratase [Alphaproteobacteria bacterium]|nr:MaoC family dehydratase [Alphaproteobacteria bacterium]